MGRRFSTSSSPLSGDGAPPFDSVVPATTAALDGIHKRIEEFTRTLTISEVAARTGHHPESVRRYLRGSLPSVAFAVAFSLAFDCNVEWLLMGIGPRRRSVRDAEILIGLPVRDIMQALQQKLDRTDVAMIGAEMFSPSPAPAP